MKEEESGVEQTKCTAATIVVTNLVAQEVMKGQEQNAGGIGIKS